MPENNELDNLAKFSFVPPQVKKDDNSKREFPKVNTVERFIRLGFSLLMAAGAIVYLVLSIVYENVNNSGTLRVDSTSSGWPSTILVCVFALAIVAASFITYLYDSQWANDKDEKVLKTKRMISTISYYAILVLTYFIYSQTALSSYVLNSFNTKYNAWIIPCFGYGLTVIMLILAVIGVLLNNKDNKKAAKIYNTAIIALAFWCIIPFAAILHKDYSIGPAGIAMLIAAGVSSDIAAVFYALQKKNTGFRTVFNIFISATLILIAICVAYYGLFRSR